MEPVPGCQLDPMAQLYLCGNQFPCELVFQHHLTLGSDPLRHWILCLVMVDLQDQSLENLVQMDCVFRQLEARGTLQMSLKMRAGMRPDGVVRHSALIHTDVMSRVATSG